MSIHDESGSCGTRWVLCGCVCLLVYNCSTLDDGCGSQPFASTGQHRVMVIVWRLRGNIIRTAVCWIVWHNVHSLQHMWAVLTRETDWVCHIAVHRGGCLELYYCNMVEWFWWDSSLILMTSWFPSVLWHCWFGHLACKNRTRNDL